MARRIGLLSGTFDPVHLGHVELARAAMVACGFDEVWFLVNHNPAHKPDVVSLAQRIEMVELAVAGEPRLSVYRGELAGEPHNWATFRRLIDSYPDDQFVFISGMDVIANLDGWDDVQSIVRGTSFAVAHRAGTPAGEIDKLRGRLGELGKELVVQVFELSVYAEASSWAVKQSLKEGERPVDLPNNVFEYIKRHGLYGMGDS